jgi:oxygen-dependent protoporphyrinogen oxidase
VGVLVVGGGITGLTAAHALARAGVPVTLVEATGRLGGKIRSQRIDGFLVEDGPDSVIATRPAALQLARELGLGPELIGVKEPRGVFIRHRGRLVPMPEGLGLVLPTRIKPFASTRLFSPLEKARMGLDVVMPRVIRPRDEAVGTFLRRRLGDALVDRLAGPLVGGIYGTPIDELSLDAVLPTLREAEREHRSLLLAGLAQGRAAAAARAAAEAERSSAGVRTTATPGAQPRSLGMFVSLAGGMGRLTDALGDSLRDAPGVDVRTATGVRSLERRVGGLRAALSDGTYLDADVAVVTTPAPEAAAVIAALAPQVPSRLASIPHGSTAIVTLAYPETAFERPPAGHGFVVAAGEDLAISACTISSGKWDGRAPEGAVLLRAFVPDGPLLAGSDEALVALARRDVGRTLGARGEPSLIRIARWVGAMPRYTVGHLERLASIEAALADEPAVVLAGAPYRGVGIPDCVSQGRAAAGRALGQLSGATAAA